MYTPQHTNTLSSIHLNHISSFLLLLILVGYNFINHRAYIHLLHETLVKKIRPIWSEVSVLDGLPTPIWTTYLITEFIWKRTLRPLLMWACWPQEAQSSPSKAWFRGNGGPRAQLDAIFLLKGLTERMAEINQSLPFFKRMFNQNILITERYTALNVFSYLEILFASRGAVLKRNFSPQQKTPVPRVQHNNKATQVARF